MLFRCFILTSLAATSIVAQRPTDAGPCDYYTETIFKNNSVENRLKFVTLVVNTAFIGNFTPNSFNIVVPGILAKGTVNGTEVDLLPYFNGGLASTNTGGTSGSSVNFLDGGGAAPLREGKASNNPESKQHRLFTHLYEFFHPQLTCYAQAPIYHGKVSQYNVHKFMALSNAEVTYFIDQFKLSALSLGVSEYDVRGFILPLASTFGMRCRPAAVFGFSAQEAQLTSICIEESCPIAESASCASYDAVIQPVNATNTASGTKSGVASATGTSSAPTTGGIGVANGSTTVPSTEIEYTGGSKNGVLMGIGLAVAVAILASAAAF